MKSVNFYRTYQLADTYERVKEQTQNILSKYLGYPELYKFNDEEKSLG